MKLTIVIIHYNTSEDLGRCLDSLTTNAPVCEHSIVVVDNASSEPGLTTVQQRFPSVKWVMNVDNVGYSRGANQGMAAVPAEYYLILNPDIQADRGAVDALVSFADGQSKAGIIGPQLLNENGTIQDSCRRFYTFKTFLLRRTFLGKIFRNTRTVDAHLMRDFDHKSVRPVDWVLGGCILVRHEALERTGPMDERFFLYFEDVDWCYRMWQAGFEVLYTPQARFMHRHRRQSARGAFHRSFWHHLGSLISFYEKWGLIVYLLKRWRGPLAVILLWLLDMAALLVAFGGAYLLRAVANPLFSEPLYPWREYRLLLLFALLLLTTTFLLSGRYRSNRLRTRAGPGAHLKTVGTASLLLLASTYLSHQQVYSRAVLLLFFPLFLLTTALGEDLYHAARRRMERGFLSLDRTLLVGPVGKLKEWLERTARPHLLGIDPVGYMCDGPADELGFMAPLAAGELPWLGRWSDVLSVVQRYRISQVVFWQQPPADQRGSELLARLRRRRIRLRWRIDESWLLVAGARPDAFGADMSAVLEPDSGSWLRALPGRLLDVACALLLLVLTVLPFGLRRLLKRGDGEMRRVTCIDAWHEERVVRLYVTGDGRVLPLWWQWPLSFDLLRGRVGLWGPRLYLSGESSDSADVPAFWRQDHRRPGLTGSWAGPGSVPPRFLHLTSLWDLVRRTLNTLLLDPGGLHRLPSDVHDPSPEQTDSRLHREVP